MDAVMDGRGGFRAPHSDAKQDGRCALCVDFAPVDEEQQPE
jgi:hypothetical protein